jgi:hypothetical protein
MIGLSARSQCGSIASPEPTMSKTRHDMLGKLAEWFDEWIERARLHADEHYVSAALNEREASQRIRRIEQGAHGLYG